MNIIIFIIPHSTLNVNEFYCNLYKAVLRGEWRDNGIKRWKNLLEYAFCEKYQIKF